MRYYALAFLAAVSAPALAQTDMHQGHSMKEATAKQAVLLEGYGSGGFPISTDNRQAQAFFDNGMQLAHAFAHKAAVEAMQEAVRLDPKCAMCLWGQAWADGPTINFNKTEDEVAKLEELAPLAPLHNPPAVLGIRVALEALPELPHIAVFDTAFFHDLPPAAATYAIDRDIAAQWHIRRYGFHGTSHQYVSEQAAAYLDRPLESLNQIVLHLGNGASASAIARGKPVDTSMGLTPLEGLVMGTRSGDIDPGIVSYLSRTAGMSVEDIETMLNKRSGMLGLGGEIDFRVIHQRIESGDAAARLAYDVYIHRLRRYVGGYMALLGRTDVITFTAGVGENDAAVRHDALSGLTSLGIDIDGRLNENSDRSARRISSPTSATTVLVIPTDEELAIARACLHVIED